MSDADLRELERRFRETGDLDDEVAWLAARLRAGALERGRLEVARLCGHPAARGVEVKAEASGDELTDCFLISDERLDEWCALGMPRKKQRRAWRYDVAACHAWLEAHPEQRPVGALECLVRMGCLVHPEFGVRAALAAGRHAIEALPGSEKDKGLLRDGPLSDLARQIEAPEFSLAEEAFERAEELASQLSGVLGSVCIALGNLVSALEEPDDLPLWEQAAEAVDAIEHCLRPPGSARPKSAADQEFDAGVHAALLEGMDEWEQDVSTVMRQIEREAEPGQGVVTGPRADYEGPALADDLRAELIAWALG